MLIGHKANIRLVPLLRHYRIPARCLSPSDSWPIRLPFQWVHCVASPEMPKNMDHSLRKSAAWRMNEPVSFREGAIPYWR